MEFAQNVWGIPLVIGLSRIDAHFFVLSALFSILLVVRQQLWSFLPSRPFAQLLRRQAEERVPTFSFNTPLHKFVEQKHTTNTLPYEKDMRTLRELGKAFETMQLGVTITDLKGKILYTNPAEAKMHGYRVKELLGKDLGIFAPGNLRRPMSLAQIDTLRQLRESVNIRKDSSVFPVKLRSDVIRDVGGRPLAIVTTCEDITQYKQMTKKQREHVRELALLNRLGDALQECENEEETYNVIAEMCRKLFPQHSGCLCLEKPSSKTMGAVACWKNAASHSEVETMTAPESSDRSTNTLCPHQQHGLQHECLSVPLLTSENIMGMLSLCLDGEPSIEEIEMKRILLNRVAKHYAPALMNIRLRERLRIEAIHDPLTGLYNRRYMQESLKHESARARRRQTEVGIIILDVDHFKQVNDQYGHQVGDDVLRGLGEFLLSHIRTEDMACRYGGEEFLLILPETSLDTARLRAEEIRRGIKQLDFPFGENALQISISLGVASFSDRDSDILRTVDAADMALYQAKAQGRDQVATASDKRVEAFN